MKLVGFVGSSSKSEAKNSNLTDPRQRLEAYCLEFMHELVAVFEEVDRIENNQYRPQFQAALEMVKTQADGIIATNLDDLARSSGEFLTLVEDTLQPENKALVVLDQQVDTTMPDENMVARIIAAVGQLGNVEISNPTPAPWKPKTANSRYTYGSTEFYQPTHCCDLLADSNKQAVPGAIWRDNQFQKSRLSIASYLNVIGYRAKKGDRWHYISVEKVLDCFYNWRSL